MKARLASWSQRAPVIVIALPAMLLVGCRSTSDAPNAADGSAGPAASEDTAGSAAADPAIYVEVVTGEPESLDPAWTYESQGMGIVANLYDTLVAFERERADAFVPALAEEWSVSDAGRRYDFRVREGVTFHAGGRLDAHDVAYSLQRAILQERSGGPTWLLLQPLFGAATLADLAVADGLAAADDDLAVADLDEGSARALCERVKEAFGHDDAGRTVTFELIETTPWFLQLVAHWIGAVVDREWMIEAGDWDGDCATWRQWHDPAAADTALFDTANGTGPYRLDVWKKGEELRLVAHDAYWRSEPAWPDGPVGPPRIGTIVVQVIDEWGTRFAKIQTGEADRVEVPLTEISQVDHLVHTVYEGRDEHSPSSVANPNGRLKLFRGYDTVTADAALFNRAINVEAGNDFVGSGALDGEGISPDFFADDDVRRGFVLCFDRDTYLSEGLGGDGSPLRGPIIAGLQGYREDSTLPGYDLNLCREALAEAWAGRLAEVGFELTVAYPEGSLERKVAAEILADGLSAADSRYRLHSVALQWPSLLENMASRRLPMAFAGWFEDYHDASNWAFAFLHSAGAYGALMGMSPEQAAALDAAVEAATNEPDSARRDELFRALQEQAVEDSTAVYLHQWQGRNYIQRGVEGWYAHPLLPTFGAPWYVLSKP